METTKRGTKQPSPVIEQTESTRQPATQPTTTQSSLKSSLAGFLNLHVVAEVVAFCVIFGWFSMKNTALSKQIEELAERLQEQEMIIERHEMAIKKLTALVTGRSITPVVPSTPIVQPKLEPVQQSQIMELMADQIKQRIVPAEHRQLPTIQELDQELNEELKDLNPSTEVSNES